MKTYIIILSESFLNGHPRAGEPTYFTDKFFKGQGKYEAELSEEWGVWAYELLAKIHTIRGNYDLWAKRIAEVQAGEVVPIERNEIIAPTGDLLTPISISIWAS